MCVSKFHEFVDDSICTDDKQRFVLGRKYWIEFGDKPGSKLWIETRQREGDKFPKDCTYSLV
jgi:hypothetical protein